MITIALNISYREHENHVLNRVKQINFNKSIYAYCIDTNDNSPNCEVLKYDTDVNEKYFLNSS